MYFEIENVNSFDPDAEAAITLSGAMGQEESRNLSENIQWGIKRKFEEGLFSSYKFSMGDQCVDGELVTVPEQAKIVRLIFALYLKGYTFSQIKKYLEESGIKTVTGKTVWNANVIQQMLKNEKYMGDALMQKTYTVVFLTKKKVINRGIVPQYYIEDNHEAIIPKELIHRVQEEKARRTAIYRPAAKKKAEPVKGKYSSEYVLSDIMVCAECVQPYRRQVWSKYGQKWAVWRCDNRLKYGSKRCKHSPTIRENTLHQAVMTAINSVVEDRGEFVQPFRENVIRIIGSYSSKGEATEYDEHIEQLQQKKMTLIEDSAKSECADEMFDKEYRVIADEIKELKKKKAKAMRERQLAESYDQRMQDMEGYMMKTSYLKREFNDDLVRRLIQTVRVINESKIEIQFKSGIVMTQRIDFED